MAELVSVDGEGELGRVGRKVVVAIGELPTLPGDVRSFRAATSTVDERLRLYVQYVGHALDSWRVVGGGWWIVVGADEVSDDAFDDASDDGGAGGACSTPSKTTLLNPIRRSRYDRNNGNQPTGPTCRADWTKDAEKQGE
jgi:hypothetical protein